MATKRTLAEQLEENANGVLRTKTTPIAETSAALGQPAAPSSPLGASGLPGATPDQAKMAGTPNQLASALGTTSVARAAPAAAPVGQAVDKGGVGGAAPASQADAQRKVDQERLASAYGDVGLKVEKLISAALPAAGAAVATPKFSVGDLSKSLPGLDPESLAGAALTSALQTLAANPSDAQAYAEAQRALSAAGHPTTDPKSLLTQADVGEAAAQAASDRIKLTPDVLEQLGIQPGEIELLGLSPDDLANTTLAQLQDRIDAKLAEEEDRLDQLAREGRDPNQSTGLAREAAKSDLAAAGASGVAAAAQSTDRLRDNVADGSTIEVGGRELTMEEFLSDKELPGLVKQYLESPETRAALDEQLGPAFGQFVRDHAEFLETAVADLDATKETATGAQSANAALLDTLGNNGVDVDSFMTLAKSIYPEIGDEFSIEKIDSSKSGVFQLLLDPTKLPEGVDPTEVFASVQKLAGVDPSLAREIMELSPEEVERAGIFYSEERMTSYLAAINERREFDADPAAYITKVFGPGGPEAAWAGALASDALGDSRPKRRLAAILDANSDGKLDDAATIQKNMSGYTNTPSPRTLAANGGKGWRTNAELVGETAKPDGLAAKIAPLVADGGISARDVKSIEGSLTMEDMRALLDSPALQNSGKKTLTKIFAKHQESATADVVNSAMKKAGIKTGPLRDATASGTLPKFGGGASNADLATFAEALRAAAASKDPYLSPSYAAGLLAQVEAEQARRAEVQGRANATESNATITPAEKARKKKFEEKVGDAVSASGGNFAGWMDEFNKDPIAAVGGLPLDVIDGLLTAGTDTARELGAAGVTMETVSRAIAEAPGGAARLVEWAQKNPGFAAVIGSIAGMPEILVNAGITGKVLTGLKIPQPKQVKPPKSLGDI